MTKINLKDGDQFVAAIRRPLAWKNANPEALISNEDGTIRTTMPWTDGLVRLFGQDSKQYWLVEAVEVNGGIVLQLISRDLEADF